VAIRRRDLTEREAPFLPETFDELLELRRQLRAAGHSPAVVNGVVAWLVGKAAGEPDESAATTRSRYRRILSDLGAPTTVPPGPRATRVLLNDLERAAA
jgi:hypothetical protein